MTAVPLPILARIAAAIIGGYLFTTVFSMLVFFLWADFQLVDPQTQQVSVDAVQSVLAGEQLSELLSFFIYAAAAMWVFHTRSAKRAWAGMLLPSVAGIGLIYLLLPPNLIPSIKEVLAAL